MSVQQTEDNYSCRINQPFSVVILSLSSHNTEKVIYFLLLERKRRKPATEDEDEPAKKPEAEPVDPPKKRLDATRLNGSNNLFYGQISEGSPLTPRRQAFK